MNCRRCNNIVPDGAKMCPFCGTGLSENNDSSSNQIKQMPSNDSSSHMIEPIKSMNSEPDTTDKKKEPNKGKKLIIWLIVGLILVGIIIIGVFGIAIPNSETDEPVVTPTEEETTVEETIIGSDELGYIALPGDWNIYEPDTEVTATQYINDDGWIVSLDSIDTLNEYTAEVLANIEYLYAVEEETIENEQIIQDTVGEYDAYKLYYYKTDTKTWCIEWYFEAEDNQIHYIALMGPDIDTEYLSVPETFSLTEIE